jgi:competence protein ComEA
VGLRFLLFATALTAAAQALPEGPNKDLVELICGSCHSTERIATKQWTKPQWQAKVLEMLQEEPDVTQPERDKIVEYLAKTFPAKVNINKAEAKELEAALELSTENAAAIVQYREKNGSFNTLDDLKKVPGLDAAKLESKKDQVVF